MDEEGGPFLGFIIVKERGPSLGFTIDKERGNHPWGSWWIRRGPSLGAAALLT